MDSIFNLIVFMLYALYFFSIFLLIATFLPFIRKEYWIFRICEYPRLQKLVLTVVCLAFWVLSGLLQGIYPLIIGGLLTLNIFYLIYLIFPFTIFASKQIFNVITEKKSNSVSIMIANVFQDNSNYKGCLLEINRNKPDLLLLLETNSSWDKAVDELKNDYPYSVKVPLENTYGMILYSKLPLSNSEVKYMVKDEIPSIHTQVFLNDNQAFQLYAVHPEPPVPNENPSSIDRDKELLLIADLAKESLLPVIVIGDLNDVAWSDTTKLFLKMSGLLDPRRGRGFFNTFNAHYPFLRFPLDHAFVSVDWKLSKIIRLRNFGSDHFPMFIKVQYEKKAKFEQEEMKPDLKDIAIAAEKKASN